MHRSEVRRVKTARIADTRVKNERQKSSERVRREARMRAKLGEGSLPYTPDVMSWLSARLNKRASTITAADVTSFLKTPS